MPSVLKVVSSNLQRSRGVKSFRNQPVFLLPQVTVSREKVTWPGATLRKANEGMPNYENNRVRGALSITFDVEFPKGRAMTADEKASLKKILNQDKVPAVYNGLAGFKVAATTKK